MVNSGVLRRSHNRSLSTLCIFTRWVGHKEHKHFE